MDLAYFTQVAAVAAVGVVIVQQILKLNFLPTNFANRHPVPTNIGLSLVAAAIAVWQNTAVLPESIWGWLFLGITTSVVAAIIYNQLLRNWQGLRATEGVKG